MTILSVQEIETLSQPHEGLCVSIYLPTIKAGDQVQQNTIRFKNLLSQAGEQLAAQGMETAQQSRFLDQASTLAIDDAFWQQQEHGLAVFITAEGISTYKLPAPVEEQVMVGNRLYLRPMLQFLYDSGEFYILALSQNQVRLLKGSQQNIEEVDLTNKDIPTSLIDALQFDEFESNIQFHTGTTGPRGQSSGTSGGERPGMFHGHGDGQDDKKMRILQYFQKIDKGLNDMLKNSQSPLVLSGVEYLQPIYKEANTYKNLVDKGIHGNPENVREDDLHKEAWKLVEPLFKTTREEIVERFNILDGRSDPLATRKLKQVIEAAPFGRVEVLFIDKNARQWGRFDTEKNQAILENEPSQENEDLIDFAAVQTLQNGGIVYLVEPEDLPGGKTVAAILRY
jgi:hypothetical protein